MQCSRSPARLIPPFAFGGEWTAISCVSLRFLCRSHKETHFSRIRERRIKRTPVVTEVALKHVSITFFKGKF